MSEPNLPDTTSDELEVGWGDDLEVADDRRTADDRIAEDRPPHYRD